MINMLICLPIIVVVIVGSDDIKSPFKLQVIVRGMSPLLMNETCQLCNFSLVNFVKSKGKGNNFWFLCK